MSNYVTRKIKEYKCRKSLKCYCEPGDEFLCQTKKIFLGRIPGQENIKYSFFSWFNLRQFFKYSLVSFFSLVFLGSGAIVYADKTNVGYSNPLYNLKRLGETVRVTLAPAQEVPILHSEFAQRRMGEIKEIEASDMVVSTTTESVTKDIKKHQEIMSNLRKQMRQDVNSAFSGIEKEVFEKENAKNFCNSMSKIMKEDEETAGFEKTEMHLKNIEKLKKNCSEFMKIDQKENSED